jgi:hypothetical protein
MWVRMSDQSHSDLINSLWGFAVQGTRQSLRDFQRLAGHLNWALNVYPLLRPGLSALYAKTVGKLEQKALIWVNRDVVGELSWVAQHLIASNGVYFLKTLAWDFHHMSQATLAVYTNASSIGLGFWYPSLNHGFQSLLPVSFPSETIFFFEALTVTAAILDTVPHMNPNDNLNTVAMFNTLAALPPYNWMLISVADVLLTSKVDLRVFFVPGQHNMVADCLSRWNNSDAIRASEGLLISPFQPPQNSLGAAKK